MSSVDSDVRHGYEQVNACWHRISGLTAELSRQRSPRKRLAIMAEGNNSRLRCGICLSMASRKIKHISRACWKLTAASTFASSVIAPGREMIESELQISRTVSVLTFSFFNLGLALGPIIGSPASEAFGRKPVYMVCMPLLLVFVMASGFSQSLASLLVCRFIGGLFGGPGLTIASATISDLFEPSERGLSLFCYYSMPWLGSVLG